ncbi:NAD(P)-dependent oxidoreductase [Hydrogenophaga sp. OTU3427]|uniref:NAD(P)-dependent oxidoreductase n=1 Tax=Hydrogenophaga sp. OTU3427 TaxID=3043856 RepID=UPI00313F30A8
MPTTEHAAAPTPLSKVAVLGIGLMGFPMARRLCEAGHTVTGWNRSRDKAERLLPFGGRVADTPAQAVRDADVVICLLTDGPAVAAVLLDDALLAALRPGACVVDMSSIKPDEARAHAARLAEHGARHVDAPVSGGTVGAEQGTLAIMAGGDEADVAAVAPVLAALGRVTHVGPHGAGQLAKLANQMIVGITIGAVAEALLLAAKGGADMGKVREALMGGFADSRIMQLHGQRMVERDFAKRAAMTVQLKDMRNAMATAQSMGFDAPVTQLFESLYAQAVQDGLSELDHSGLFVALAQRNGMT